jgi:hypothetical protein
VRCSGGAVPGQRRRPDRPTPDESTDVGAYPTALAAVQGVYLVADTSSGELYVGKADGTERLLGRWSAYARDGHGGTSRFANWQRST